MPYRRIIPGIPIAVALLGLLGCQQWLREAKTVPPSLPPIRAALESVALEVCFVHLDSGDEAALEQLWDHLDEQQLDPQLRRRLAANGLRCGVIETQLPEPLLELLDSPSRESNRSENQLSSAENVQVDRSEKVTHRLLHCRAGRQAEIIASGPHEKIDVLYNETGQLRGQTCENAQCMLILTPRITEGGEFRVELVPEIQYGQPRHEWTADHGVFRQQIGRRRKTFESMTIDQPLRPGQTLIVASRPEMIGGLGTHFFAEQEEGATSERKLLLIRLAQTNHDSLFLTEQIQTAINALGE